MWATHTSNAWNSAQVLHKARKTGQFELKGNYTREQPSCHVPTDATANAEWQIKGNRRTFICMWNGFLLPVTTRPIMFPCYTEWTSGSRTTPAFHWGLIWTWHRSLHSFYSRFLKELQLQFRETQWEVDMVIHPFAASCPCHLNVFSSNGKGDIFRQAHRCTTLWTWPRHATSKSNHVPTITMFRMSWVQYYPTESQREAAIFTMSIAAELLNEKGGMHCYWTLLHREMIRFQV